MIRECGAKARTNNYQPCRRLAMANGRCRLHGGMSTGPKTIEGKQKAITAPLKHGFYSKKSIEERQFLRQLIRNHEEQLSSLF